MYAILCLWYSVFRLIWINTSEDLLMCNTPLAAECHSSAADYGPDGAPWREPEDRHPHKPFFLKCPVEIWGVLVYDGEKMLWEVEDTKMNASEIFVSFIIGMITGFVTGALVTKYYRAKDQKKSEEEKVSRTSALLMNYLDNILTELEIIRKDNNHGYAELERLIKKKSIRYEILPEFFGGTDTDEFGRTIQILLNFEKMIDNGDVDLSIFQEGMKEINMLALQNELK